MQSGGRGTQCILSQRLWLNPNPTFSAGCNDGSPHEHQSRRCASEYGAPRLLQPALADTLLASGRGHSASCSTSNFIELLQWRTTAGAGSAGEHEATTRRTESHATLCGVPFRVDRFGQRCWGELSLPPSLWPSVPHYMCSELAAEKELLPDVSRCRR